MDLLNELLEIRKELSFNALLEDLGKLKELGLGRMVNAFKQSYHGFDTGRGSQRRVGIATSEIGNRINSYNTGIGANSEAIDVPKITSWSTIKKAFKANEDRLPAAAVFYVNNKAVALLIAGSWELTSVKSVVGLSWDFTGTSATEEDINKMTSPLAARVTNAYRGTVTTSKGKEKSAGVEEKARNDGGDSPRLSVKHYQGVAQEVRSVALFFDAMFEVFPNAIKMKLITIDHDLRKKRSDRYGNADYASTKTSDLKMFADDIKTRLAKFKNSKVASVEDMQEFVAKVFTGGGLLKKLNFAGLTYEAVPAVKELGSNDSRKYSKEFQRYHDRTMHDLFSGKEVSIEFESDRAASQYHSLYIIVKFKDGMIKPVKAKYFDANEKKNKEVTL